MTALPKTVLPEVYATKVDLFGTAMIASFGMKTLFEKSYGKVARFS